MKRNAFTVFAALGFLLSASCDKSGSPTDPSSTQKPLTYISIPAPTTPAQAFMRYQRPPEVRIIHDPPGASEAFLIRWHDNGSTHQVICDATTMVWDAATSTSTCTLAF